MSTTQTIRFALKDFQFRETFKGKGVVEYHLVDEHGNERKVSAMAELNWRKQVCSVRPIHHREMPLVEVLAKASLNETFEVDFSEFNKKYARGSIRSKKMAIRNIKVSKHDSACITSISSLVDHKARFMQLIAIAVAGFAAVMLFMHNA